LTMRLKLLSDLKSTLAGRLFQTLTTRSLKKVDLTRIVQLWRQVATENKTIVDYTSPALCTPVTPLPTTGDAAYRQRAAGMPSHGHRQHAQKNWQRSRVWFRRYILVDRQTDTQTDILVTILRNRSRRRSNN